MSNAELGLICNALLAVLAVAGTFCILCFLGLLATNMIVDILDSTEEEDNDD